MDNQNGGGSNSGWQDGGGTNSGGPNSGWQGDGPGGGYQPPPPPPKDPGQGLGIAGMVLGILGVCTSAVYGGFVFGLVGLILSVVALNKSKEAGFSNGMAIAGIVCSIISLATGILCICICGGLACASLPFAI